MADLSPLHSAFRSLLHLHFSPVSSLFGCHHTVPGRSLPCNSQPLSSGSVFDVDLDTHVGKCLFVALRDSSEPEGGDSVSSILRSAERGGDSVSAILRSADVTTWSNQNDTFPSIQGSGVVSFNEPKAAITEGEHVLHSERQVSDGHEAAAEKGWIRKAALASVQAKALMRDISVLERVQIGAGAGGIAGAITYACLHPLDTVKTKLQTRGASDLYSGPIDVIVKTFEEQGVLGFYSGISAVLVGSMFSSAVYFGTCELGKALLSQVPNFPPIMVPPLAGAMGNLSSSAILVPKEVITQRMQVGTTGRSWEVLVRTVEKEGLGGLYTGYSAALVRNLPASVLSFSSFEYLKAAWLGKTGKNRLEPWQSVTSGALAGAISAALTTPLDVVKTRLMTQARNMPVGTGESLTAKTLREAEAKITASTYEGISRTLRKIWLEEGWKGLSKGVVPRILYSAFFSALGYFAFETARLELVKRHIARKKNAAFA